MSYNVVVTSGFKRQIKKLTKRYQSIKSDVALLVTSLENDPMQGEPLGKDCFKIRMAIKSKGRGKSGGARVITCVKIIEADVFLLSIYDKSEKESLTEKEIDHLLGLSGLG